MRISVRRPSPALAISCVALTVALGGTSYATVLNVPDNSVGTAKIKNGAVTTPKLKNDAVTELKIRAGAVTSSEVKNSSLLAADFRPGQLPAGPAGSQGPAGISGFQRFDVLSASSSASSREARVTCPTGKRPVGGGARVIGRGAVAVSITESFPDSDSFHWNTKANEVVATPLTWQLQAYALCATVAG